MAAQRRLFHTQHRVREVGPYALGPLLGRGAHSEVRLARYADTGRTVAVKVYAKRTLVDSPELTSLVQRETSVLREFHHPHVVALLEVLETRDEVLLIMEHLANGELYDRIDRAGRLSEAEARQLMTQLLDATSYCHRKGYAHGDIKCENILLDGAGQLVLADFGLCVPTGLTRATRARYHHGGSPHYCAPEVFKCDVYSGVEADVWSCGVVLYAMLVGKLPFEGTSLRQLMAAIKKAQLDVPQQLPPVPNPHAADVLSPEACDLLAGMLERDPKRRLSIAQVLDHAWFQLERERSSPGSRLPPPSMSTSPGTDGGPESLLHFSSSPVVSSLSRTSRRGSSFSLQAVLGNASSHSRSNSGATPSRRLARMHEDLHMHAENAAPDEPRPPRRKKRIELVDDDPLSSFLGLDSDDATVFGSKLTSGLPPPSRSRVRSASQARREAGLPPLRPLRPPLEPRQNESDAQPQVFLRRLCSPATSLSSTPPVAPSWSPPVSLNVVLHGRRGGASSRRSHSAYTSPLRDRGPEDAVSEDEACDSPSRHPRVGAMTMPAMLTVHARSTSGASPTRKRKLTRAKSLVCVSRVRDGSVRVARDQLRMTGPKADMTVADFLNWAEQCEEPAFRLERSASDSFLLSTLRTAAPASASPNASAAVPEDSFLILSEAALQPEQEPELEPTAPSSAASTVTDTVSLSVFDEPSELARAAYSSPISSPPRHAPSQRAWHLVQLEDVGQGQCCWNRVGELRRLSRQFIRVNRDYFTPDGPASPPASSASSSSPLADAMLPAPVVVSEPVADSLPSLHALSPKKASFRLFRAAEMGNADEVCRLLERDDKVQTLVEARGVNNWSALHYAARRGETHVVRILLDAGFDAEAVSKTGWSSLMMACERAHADCAELLLRRGGNPARSCPDSDPPLTPLYLAQQALLNAKDEETVSRARRVLAALHAL